MSQPAWPYPRVIAHRGGGALAPENTLAALRVGAERGFRAVEFDVMLAGDATPVLIHDETLERTTGTSGEVAASSYAKLAALDAGAWKGERWRGERIPRFEDAARLCRELGLWANVEIKPAAGHEAATGEAAARVAEAAWRGAALTPLLSSFSAEALAAARRAEPQLPRGHLFDAVPPDWRARLEAYGCVALHCNWKSLDAALCARIHAAGYAVLAWTVNDVTLARTLFAWGVNAIFTDALEEIGPAFA
jgi:glycerophosphoryl diester phosphodiesterase